MVDRARRKIRSVVSVFLFQGIRIFVETNGPRDQWLAALASNYELLPRERDGGPEQRETKERRVADLRMFARYTIKFTIESNAIGRYNVVGLARYINCRPSGSLVDNWSTIQIGAAMILCCRRISLSHLGILYCCFIILLFSSYRVGSVKFFWNISFIFKIFEIKEISYIISTFKKNI